MNKTSDKLLIKQACYFFLFVFVFSFTGFAQSGEQPLYIKVKFDESFVERVESATMRTSDLGYLQTGISEIDSLSAVFHLKKMERVFPFNAAFDTRHRAYGLHQWYRMATDEAEFQAMSCASVFEQCGFVLEAEVPLEKSFNDGYTRGEFTEVPGTGSLKRTSTTDPRFPDQWHYENTGQSGGTAGADISLLDAWSIQSGSDDVIVAIIDGGIDTRHEDLKDALWTNDAELNGTAGVDDDGNGYVDDIYGYSFADNRGAVSADRHGTHVAGTVGAVSNNGVGVAGVAGGDGTNDGVRLMSCEVFGISRNDGFDEAFIYAADNGAIISQNSWGYTSPGVYEQSVLDAIDYFIDNAGFDASGNPIGPMQGGIVIFAAGNSNSSAQYYPGYYAPVVAVASTDDNDRRSSFSNYGTWVDIAAPGSDVLSAFPGNAYGTLSGTSMACPHVSGVVALMVSEFGQTGYTPREAEEKLLQSTDNIDSSNPGYVGRLGSGRANAYQAVQSDTGVPPSKITDLSNTTVTETSATLTWTASGRNGDDGKAHAYEIRYSTDTIVAADFDDAELYFQTIVPKESGETEVFVVQGLVPETKYYFALKARNFFGNTSEISNVAVFTTADAAILEVQPDALVISLDEGNDITVNITLNNTGKETLNFNFPDYPAGTSIQSFVTEVTPNTGTINANGSQNVSLKFDAGTNVPGNYFDQIRIASNDLVTPIFNLEALMHINGLPELTSSADTLDFGSLFNFDADTAEFVLSNTGNDTLNISQVDISGDFTFNTGFTAAPYYLMPGETSSYEVLFNPTTLGSKSGQVRVTSNDPVHPDSTFVIIGQSIEGPVLSISPDSIGQALVIPDSIVRNLQIQNTGGSDLIFSVDIASPDRSFQLSGQQMTSYTLDGVTTNSQMLPPATFELKNLNGLRVTFIEQGYMGTFINDLTDRGAEVNVLFGFDEQVLARTDILILDDAMTGFSSSEVTFVHEWIEQGGNALLLGDNTATETNENLILTGSGIQFDAMGNYLSETFTDILEHPMTEGVTNLYAGAYGGLFILSGNAKPVVYNGNNQVFSAVSTLGLGSIVVVGDEGMFGGGFSIYNNRLFGNQIIDYLQDQSAGSWLTLNTQEDTVAVGASVDLEVSLNSKRLIAGTYEAILNFSSNDPQNRAEQIPVVFELTGTPELMASDSLLDFGDIFIDQSDSLILTVSNEGTDQLIVSNVTSDVAFFSVDTTAFSLEPGENLDVRVYYAPTTVSNKTGILTITSNDRQGIINIDLQGDPFEPPVFGALTDTVAVTLNYGDSTTQTLSIANQAASGAADLEFDLGIEINTSAVTNASGYSIPNKNVNLEEASFAEQRLIVKFQPGISSQSQAEIRQQLGADVLKQYTRTGIELWSIDGMTVVEAISTYGDDPRLLYIEPDFIVETIGEPNDANFDELWGMHNTGQTGGTDDADIDALEAWDITTGNNNIVVGIIDTGIDYDHEDLRDNMWTNPGEIADNGVDDDGNGYIDDVYGWDFVNNDNDPFDGHSHGTHVAGTVGARGNNGIGVTGVAWRTQLMALKFLSDFGSGYTSDAIEAVEYAVNNGAHLTNNSWGGGAFSQALKDAITQAHLADQLFVAAAGNSSSNNDTNPSYPASYDVDNIISVAATDHNDGLAYFSNYGLETVDLAAPGVSILSSVPNNGYSSFNGTSMASPHVAGAIALTWSQAPSLSNMQMKTIVLEQVDPIPSLGTRMVSGGRLNVLNMVQNTIGWIGTDIRSGVVDAGSSEDVTVAFNAANTYGGTYLADLVVTTNDPVNVTRQVVLKMVVNGIPEIDVNVDSIGFGEQYINTTTTQSLSIINDGTDLLEVSAITFDNPDFASDSSSINVKPGEEQIIQISYLPTVDELDVANMTLVSNDTSRASVIVKLTGTGILPPVIEVSPDSVGLAMLSGDSITQVLTIENTGSSDLIFELGISNTTQNRAQYELPAGTIAATSLDGETPAPGTFEAQRFELADLTDKRITFIDQGILSVLKSDLTVRGAIVQSFINFEASILDNTDVLVLDDALARIQSESLQAINDWIQDGGHILLLGDNSSTEASQNVIAAGSGILLDTFGFFEGEYLADIESHETTRGVSQLFAGAYGGILVLSGQAQPLVRVADGNVFAAYAPLGFGEVVVVADEGMFGNEVYVSNNRLFGNQVIDYLAGTFNRWISLDVPGDTIVAGSSQDIDLDINATGLYTGLYQAEVEVTSNDPVNAVVRVPVAIDVTGVADINLPVTTIDFGTPFTGTTVTDTLLIQNVGTDTLRVSSMVVNNPDFAISSTTADLPPESDQYFTVTYAPVAAEIDDAVLTITSDDPKSGTVTVDLLATGLAPPILDINPDSIGVTLFAGDSTQSTLKIENAGVSDLIYEIELRHQQEAGTTYEFLGGQEDSDESIKEASAPIPVRMELFDLTGFNIAFVGNNNAISNISSDLRSRGAIVNWYSDFEEVILLEADVLVVDDKVQYFSSAAIDAIHDWVITGGSILIQAQHGARYAVNEILAGSDITLNGYTSNYGSFRNFGLHETTKGITNLYAPYNSGNYVLTGQAEPLVYGTNGSIFSASAAFEEGHVIVMGNDDVIGSRILSYDNRLFSNQVMDYLAFQTINWIAFTTQSDTLTAGSYNDLVIDFNARELNASFNKVYLSVTSNDPVTPNAVVPVTLTVTGEPEISLSETELDFGTTFVGATTADTIRIQNIGTDTLTISGFSVGNTDFSLSHTSMEIAPGLEQLLLVDYAPVSEEVDNATLTITSDDAVSGTIEVDLIASAIDPPVINISPDSVGVTLFSGDSSVHTVTVQNTGASDLFVSINTRKKATSLSTFEFMGGQTEAVSAEGDTTTMTQAFPIQMELADLTGFNISFMGYSYGFSSFISAIRARGAEVTTYYGIDNDALQTTDVLVIGQQRLSWLSTSDFENVNEWVQDGGSLLIMANNYEQTEVNAILSGSNIQANGSNYIYGYFSSINEHETTRGVNSLYAPYRTAKYDLSGSAKALILYNTTAVHAAVTDFGRGQIVAIGNDDMFDNRINYADNRLFGNQIIDYLALSANRWLFVDTESDTLIAGGSVDIDLKFNASGLNASFHEADLSFTSNDPINPIVNVPLSLTVTGEPEIFLSATSLDFDTIYTGTDTRRQLTLANGGTDTLKVSNVTTDKTMFSVNTTNFDIPPDQEKSIIITYAPLVAGKDDATLTITSNDPVNNLKEVDLIASALSPPVIELGSDSLGVALFSGDSIDQMLRVENTGLSDLIYELQVRRKSNQTSSFEFLAGQEVMEGSESEVSAAVPTTMELGDLTNINISIVGYYYSSNSLYADLTERGATVFRYSNFYTYILDDADVLILDNNLRFYNSSTLTFIRNWVLSGGSLLILAEYSAQYDVNQILAGSGMELSGSSYNYGSFTDFGTHETLEGVSSLYAPYSAANYTVSGSAKPLVYDASGAVYAATTKMGAGRVFVMGNEDLMYSRFTYSDNRLFGNQVIDYLALSATSWIKVDNAPDTVSAGTYKDVPLQFNAKGLNAGLYQAELTVSSNDPVTPGLIVPLSLTVSGEPVIELSGQTIEFGGHFLTTTAIDSVVIQNIGTDTLEISDITIANTDFSVSSTTATIPPESSHEIQITYSPVVAEVDDVIMSIFSNDPNSAETQLSLKATGVSPPVIAINPDSLGVTINARDSINQTLNIVNSGLSELTVAVNIQAKSVSTSAFELMAGEVPENEGVAAQSATPIRMDLSDLTGTRISFVGYNSYMTTIISDLTERGAEVMTYSNFAESILDDTDVMILDDRVRYFSTSSWEIIRNWTKSGGSLLLTAVSSAQSQINAILMGSDIQMNGSSYTYGSFSNLGSHETTEGISSLYAPYSAATYELTGAATTLITTSNHEIYSAVSRFGNGTVLVMGNDDLIGRRLLSYDNRLFANQVFDFLSGASYRWLSVAVNEDTVAASSTRAFQVKMNAKDLFAGVYDAQLSFGSNDPVTPEVIVPVTLTVNGQPEVELSDNSLDFGTPFTGTTVRDTVRIHNVGTDTLKISSITVDNTDFTLGSSTAEVLPSATHELYITYSPVASEVDNATVTIDSNDPLNTQTLLSLVATGLAPPVIDVTPDSLGLAIISGASAQRILTVKNTGISDLIYEVKLQRKSSSAASFEFLSGQTPDESMNGETGSGGSMVQMTLDDLTGFRISFVGYNYSSTSFISDLTTRGATVLDELNFRESILEETDVLVLDHRMRYISSSSLSAIRQWVQEGGSLLITADVSAQAAVNTVLTGSGISLTSSYYSYNSFTNISSHPTTEGISTLYGPYSSASFTLSGVAQELIRSSTGDTFGAASGLGQGKVIVLGNDDLFGRWITLYDNRLFGNQVMDYLTSAIYRWISLSNEAGTIAGNSTVNLPVSLDADDLYAGIYEAELSFRSNDPVTPELNVPVSITVTGKSEIVLSETELKFGKQFTGTTTIESFIISNEGTDTLKVTDMVIDNLDYTPDNRVLTILPGHEKEVSISFAPQAHESDNTTMTVFSNDPDNGQTTISLKGRGVDPPVMVLNPDSTGMKVIVGDVVKELVTVQNTGKSDLTFTLGVGRSASSVATYEFPAGEVLNGEASVPVQAELADLTGLNVSFYEYTNMSSLRIDLSDRGAVTSRYYRFSSTMLSQSDVIVIDDRLQNLHEQELKDLRKWVAEGGNLLLLSSSSYSQTPINTILSSTDIQMGSLVNYYGTYTDIASHESTTGVSTLLTNSSIRKLTVGAQAESLVRSDNGDVLSATTRLGLGQILVIGSSQMFGSWYSYYDNRLFGNQVIDFLALSPKTWLSASAKGQLTVTPGASLDIELTYDATNQDVDEYEGRVLFYTNNPTEPNKSLKVTMSVVDGANADFSEQQLDFTDQFVGTTASKQINVSNKGTETLIVTDIDIDHSAYVVDVSSFSLSAGESRTLTVTYLPTNEGTHAATLSLVSNDATSTTASVDILGTAIEAPVIAVDPESISLSVYEGETTQQQIQIDNVGGSDLIWTLDTESSWMSFDRSASETSAAGSSTKFTVYVNVSDVSAGQTVQGTIEINSNDPATPQVQVPVNVNVLYSSKIVMSSTSLDFGQVQNGSTSTQVVTVTNEGTADLEISDLIISEEFSTTVDTDMVIAPGGSSDIDVTFEASSIGDFDGVLTFSTNDPDSPELEVSLQSTVFGIADFYIERDTLDLGVFEFDEVKEVALSIQNLGELDLEVSNVTVDNQLFLFDQTSFTVIADAYFTVNVSLNEFDEGTYLDILTFSSNDPDEPEKQVVLVAERLGRPELSLSTTEIQFGTYGGEASVTQTIMVYNTGGSPLRISDIISDHTAFVADLSELVIEAQDSAALLISYESTEIGDHTGQLTLNTNDPFQTSLIINLSGSVEGTDNADVTDTEIDFGEVFEESSNAYDYVIENDGPDQINIISITTDHDYFTASAIDGFIAAGSSLPVNITFTPMEVGTFECELTIETDQSLITMVLKGSGISATPQLTSNIGDVTIAVGDTQIISLNAYFSDPMGGQLSYEFTYDVELLTTSLTDGELDLSGLKVGSGEVTVTADNGVRSATQQFSVNVENALPELLNQIADQELNVGELISIDLNEVFYDANDEDLIYAVTEDPAWEVTINTSGVVEFAAVSAASGEITITATDAYDASVSTTFGITILDASDPTLGISSSGMDVKVYPNPGNGQLYLSGEFTNSQLVKVEVFNLSGTLIDFNYDVSERLISLERVEEGIYFVRLQFEDQEMVIRKFSVRN